jgi:hypothetical protein
MAQPFLPALSEVEGAVLLGLSFLNAVIPTGMADLLFRSRRANVGHGAEGPRQHFDPCSALKSANLFGALNERPAERRLLNDFPA